MNQPLISEETRPAPPLWRNRDFLLLWSGQSISTLGTGVSLFALPLLVLALTSSPALAGLMTAVRQAPYLLFSLPAGALVDRWDRKRVMIRCDAVRWLALGSLPLAFALGHLTLAQVYVIAFVEGTANVLFSLAQLSALPQVVPPAQLTRAYSLDNANEYVGALLGPALGALIIGLAPIVEVGTMLAYLTDSVSYLVSVISLRFIRISFQQQREAASQHNLRAEIAEGLRFLWKERRLRLMVILTTTINFLQSPITLAVILLAQKGLLWPIYGVTLVSYRLEVTPDALQGRVNSAFRFLSYGAEPLGAALGGVLLAALGPRPVLGLIAAGLALCALVVLGTELRKV